MNAITIFKIIEDIYNSLYKASILNMFPFLLLKKIGDNLSFCFSQYKGKYESKYFHIYDLKVRDINVLTPYRYFLNRLIFNRITSYLRTGEYGIFISFLTHNKLLISLYNMKREKIVKYKIKLFSLSVNLTILDYFYYLFGDKITKAEMRKKIYENKLNKYNLILEDKELYDYKAEYNKTKELIKELHKRYKEEQEKQKELDFNLVYEEQKKGVDQK